MVWDSSSLLMAKELRDVQVEYEVGTMSNFHVRKYSWLQGHLAQFRSTDAATTAVVSTNSDHSSHDADSSAAIIEPSYSQHWWNHLHPIALTAYQVCLGAFQQQLSSR